MSNLLKANSTAFSEPRLEAILNFPTVALELPAFSCKQAWLCSKETQSSSVDGKLPAAWWERRGLSLILCHTIRVGQRKLRFQNMRRKDQIILIPKPKQQRSSNVTRLLWNEYSPMWSGLGIGRSPFNIPSFLWQNS